MMEYTFTELVDLKKMEELINLFYKASGIGIAILDLNGHILAASVGDHSFTNECHDKTEYFNKKGGKFKIHQRVSGDLVWAPILVQGQVSAILLTSRLLLEKCHLDNHIEQEKNLSCNHLNSDEWQGVPVISEQQLKYMLNFLSCCAGSLAEMGLKEWNQKRAQIELQEIKDELNISQKILMAAFEELKEQYERI